jgi:hypothetical protein
VLTPQITTKALLPHPVAVYRTTQARWAVHKMVAMRLATQLNFSWERYSVASWWIS